MIDPGNFVDNYRILNRSVSSTLSSTYIVEHTTHGTRPVLLTCWHNIMLTASEDIQAFQKKALQGVIVRDAQTIPILDAKLYQQSPYIVTEFDEKASTLLNDYATFVDQVVDHARVMQPADPHAPIDAFLSAFGIPSEIEENNNTINTQVADEDTILSNNIINTQVADENTILNNNTINTQIADEATILNNNTSFTYKTPILLEASTTLRQWIRQPLDNRNSRIISLVLLLVLLAGGLALMITFLPASTATVTITPMSEQINRTYDISLVTDSPQPGQASEYTISYTTPPQSKKVNTTGKGHHDAVQAQGKVVISQIHLFNASDNNATVGVSNVPASDGTMITINDFTATEGGSVTVDAKATNPGPSGNIAAYDIDHEYQIVRYIGVTPGPVIGTAYNQNPNAFTGGADAGDYMYVQQEDIDGATDSLSTQMMPDALQHTEQMVQTDEELLNNITCKNDVSTDHKVQDAADSVTATVKVTCSGLAFKPQEVSAAAINAQKADQFVQHRDSYHPSGAITTGQLDVILSSDSSAYTLKVPTKGNWVFQIDEATQRDIARSIAGRSQHDATDQILKTTGIKDVTITTAGSIGTALPTSPENIRIIIT